MKKFYLSLASLLIVFATTSESVFASCDIGSTLFRDTLYGAAVGAGVGGLVLLSNQSSTNVPPTLATAALIGAGTGAVVGVVEISLSNCISSRSRGRESREESYNGIKVKPLVTIRDDKIKTPSIQREEVEPLDLNQVGAGLTVEYPIN